MRTNLVCNLYFPDPPGIVFAVEIGTFLCGGRTANAHEPGL